MSILSADTTVGFGPASYSSNYVIEEEQEMSHYLPYHRTYRIYHGDDTIRTMVTTGTLSDLGGRQETINDYGFGFSGTKEASTPYMMGGSTQDLDELQILGDMFDLNGNIITPTFYYDTDANKLIASQKCFGVVTAPVTVLYTLYGFTHDFEYSPYAKYSKSTLYAYGITSGAIATQNIPEVLVVGGGSGENDKIEIYTIVSYRYITDETGYSKYESGPRDTSDSNAKYFLLPEEYQGDNPSGARIEERIVHERGYMTPISKGKLGGRVDIETFNEPSVINREDGSVNYHDVTYPILYMENIYSDNTELEEQLRLDIQKAIADRNSSLAEQTWLNYIRSGRAINLNWP